MGWHHLTQGRGVHSPYRWIVTDEQERLAISVNDDGSPITILDGLYCACLQSADSSAWIITSLDPITWTQVSGSSDEVKKSVVSIHAPTDTAFPFGVSGGAFTNIYARRQTPNIGSGQFEQYKHCWWKITETSALPTKEKVSEVTLQFEDYGSLIDYLNANLINSDSHITHNLSIEGFYFEDATIDPLRKTRGINRFFSNLRGKSKYTATSNDSKCYDYNGSSWPIKDTFLTAIYSNLLGITPTPSDNLGKTLWFSQTPKKMYNHHRNNISFELGSAGERRYFHLNNGVTYAGTNGGLWEYDSSMLMQMNFQSWENFQIFDDTEKSQRILDGGSAIRVSLYRSSLDINKVVFVVKPIGMDLYHLGHDPDMSGDKNVYVEYRYPDGFPRLVLARTFSLANDFENFGENNACRVSNGHFITQFPKKVRFSNKRTSTDICQFRFIIMGDDGRAYKPSRWFSIYNRLPEVNVSILQGNR